jgi:hypothetical protein
MTMRACRTLLGLTLIVSLAGCGSSATNVQTPSGDSSTSAKAGQEKPSATKPGSLGRTLRAAVDEVSLAELLKKPRVELAALAEEYLLRIRRQEGLHAEGKLLFPGLPDLRLPLVVPVFRQASYAAGLGVSLPPYLKEGDADSALALHLARHGDVEAAKKLVKPNDGETARQVDNLALERNYPVEWTRLVGLMLHAAQFSLATGNVDGAKQLVSLHRQLSTVLDDRARRGALGAALLPRGKNVLKQVAAVWRKDKKEKLASEADSILAEWGETPSLRLHLGETPAEVAALLGGTTKGRVILGSAPLRALDLLALPVPDRVDHVLACFDCEDRLAELWLTYPAASGEFTQPTQLGHWLEELFAGQERQSGLPGRRYRAGDWSCEVILAPNSPFASALVRLDYRKQAPPALRRDFGSVHLDRSFEHNRLRFAWKQRGQTLTVKETRALSEVRNPLPSWPLAQARLERQANGEHVAQLELAYGNAPAARPSLVHLLLPLLEVAGVPRVAGEESGTKGYLETVWHDGQTQYVLRLPNKGGTAPVFQVTDQTPDDKVDQRYKRVTALDEAELRARLADNKPISRVPRELEHARLGMSRAELEQRLPQNPQTLRRDILLGLAVTFTSPPDTKTDLVLRDLFVRFDGSGKALEVRGRLTETSGAAAKWLAAVKALCGPPDEGRGSEQRWADLPPRKPAPVFYRWQDDVSSLYCTHDASGLEVILRQRLPDYPDGIPFPDLRYLPRGPENCSLGDSKAALLKKWNVEKPVLVGDAIALPAAADGPYDGMLVWFEGQGEGELVSRIVARHRLEGKAPSDASQAAQAVMTAWGREARSFGWPWRQEFDGRQVLQSLGSSDQWTRLRVFWQESAEGIHVFTEWKALQ